jgi:hypothetical protein
MGKVEKLALPTTEVVALSCGDLDGKGGSQVVVVGRRKIVSGRLGVGRFDSATTVPWSDLSPVAPRPLREPIASAEISPGRYVDVGVTDRASGLRLSATLAPLAKLDAPIPWPRAGCLSRSGIAVGAARPCAAGEAVAPVDVRDVAETDAVAGAAVVDGTGHVHSIVAFRTPDGAVTLRDEAGHSTRTSPVGAALALGDLNLDGEPELVTSLDTQTPTEDALVVSTWGKEGVRERFRVPVPEGVHAVAICPSGDGKLAPIVAATSNNLWVVR